MVAPTAACSPASTAASPSIGVPDHLSDAFWRSAAFRPPSSHKDEVEAIREWARARGFTDAQIKEQESALFALDRDGSDNMLDMRRSFHEEQPR